MINIEGSGYQPEGRFTLKGREIDALADVETSTLLWAAALANDAVLETTGASEDKVTYRMVGDPTEGALLVAAGKANLWRTELEQNYPRVAEVPFDSERKRMTTIHDIRLSTEDDGSPFLPGETGYVVCVKGAPDLLLEQSNLAAPSQRPAAV